MTRLRSSTTWFLASAVWWPAALALLVGATSVRASDRVVIVQVHPAVSVSSDKVTIGDVADIHGADVVTKRRMSTLSLGTLDRSGQPVGISLRRVHYRLLLAGFSKDEFIVAGKDALVTRRGQTQVAQIGYSRNPVHSVSQSKTPHFQLPRASHGQRANTLSMSTRPQQKLSVTEQVKHAARECVLSRLPWDDNDIEVNVTAISTNQSVLDRLDGAEFTAELRSAFPPLGRVQVAVVPKKRGSLPINEIPVFLDVKHFQEVVVSKRGIAAGRPITADDVYIDRREIEKAGDVFRSLDDVVGKTLARGVKPLSVVSPTLIKQKVAPNPANQPYVVNIRSRVRMVGRSGILMVSMIGEAMERGRVGDLIRVRNVDSKKEVLGRVISASQVEIPL